jgi:hypothetical protein
LQIADHHKFTMPTENNTENNPEQPEKQVLFVAKHTFAAEEQQDLPLEKGQLVYGNFLEDAWWVGEDPVTGKGGVFPANFVCKVASDDAKKVIRKLEKKDPENPRVLAFRQAEANNFVFAPTKKKKATENAATPEASTNNSGNDFEDVRVDIEDDITEKTEKTDTTATTGKGEQTDVDSVTSREEDKLGEEKSDESPTVKEEEKSEHCLKLKLHKFECKIFISATKCLLALISFSCLAGGQFHNISFMSATTNKAYTGDAPEAVFYIVSAVQFSIAWGILMWLSETCLTITLYLRTRGVLYPNVQEIIDQKPMYYLYYDVLNLFMLSVAGFNMGAAASLPPKVIKLLVQTDFTELKNSAIFNCSDTTIYDNVNSTMVTCPSQFKDIDSGVGQNVENISICKLR